MNIRYIKSNISKISENNLIKFLYDIILNDINDINSYEPGRIYTKGDKVYLQEIGKHQVFRCSVDESSSVFNYDEWDHVLEFFDGNVYNYHNLKIKEEVHIIDESNRNQIITKLVFNHSRSTVAVYCGKQRYVNKYDFEINDDVISFNEPFNVGDRIILEVRESIGKEIIGIVLYDLEAKPYKVFISADGEIEIYEHDEITEDDVKYVELVTGDATYTLLVDGGSQPYELKAHKKIETYITGTNDDHYNVKVVDGELQLIPAIKGKTYSDTKYILGLDKKFYTLDLVDGEIVATEVYNSSLDPENFDMGVRLISDKFESLLICIDDGNIFLMPYINNDGHHNINLIDHADKEWVRVIINEDNDIELHEGMDTDGDSGTRLMEYFYFFDNEWNFNRLFVENRDIYYEPCDMEVIPDSRGINLLKSDGEMFKLMLPKVGDLCNITCINIVNRGTFESPIEGFVVKIDGEVKLVTVNKNTDDFEIIDTNLPFRTNFHYIMSRDGMIYKLVIANNTVYFAEAVEEYGDVIHYIDAGNGVYYYLNEYDGEVEIRSTTTLPEEAIFGEVVVEYNGQKYRLIHNNGPVFEQTESSNNGFQCVRCLNSDKVCTFSLNEDLYYGIGNTSGDGFIIGDYILESVTTGAFIKSNEMITRFDIVDGVCVFNPISTFVHRIKSDNGNAYLLDVEGEPYTEIITMNDIDTNEYDTEVGYGYLYLSDYSNNHYKVSLNSDNNFDIEYISEDYGIDYNVSSVIQTSQGLYNIYVEDNEVKINKTFDNMYGKMLSYGNIVKKSYNVYSRNGKRYALAANGLGEVVVTEPLSTVAVKGTVLRSDDGYIYGLGVIDGQFVTYRIFIDNPRTVKDTILIKDVQNNLNYKLFMKGDRLYSEETNNEVYQTHAIMSDVYNNQFKIEFENSKLKISAL